MHVYTLILIATLSGCSLAGGAKSFSTAKATNFQAGLGTLIPSSTPIGLHIRFTTPFTPAGSQALVSRPTRKSILPTVTKTRGKPSATSSPSLTPTSDLKAAQDICSPLKFVDLIDLPKVISDRYNPPPMGSDARHQGVDFAYYHWKGDRPLDGTDIQAVLGGTVVAAIKNSFPFGNLIIIETPVANLSSDIRDVFGIDQGDSLYMMYAHMNESSPIVKLGDKVISCETIGYVGHTGNTEASHLHLEARVGPAGAIFEGFSAFRETDTLKEKQNYRLWRTSGQFLHFDPLRLLLFEFNHGATATPTPAGWRN
jgi:murein DD-endopeptidase MepM/ murein hydrolase activator NlpD